MKFDETGFFELPQSLNVFVTGGDIGVDIPIVGPPSSYNGVFGPYNGVCVDKTVAAPVDLYINITCGIMPRTAYPNGDNVGCSPTAGGLNPVCFNNVSC